MSSIATTQPRARLLRLPPWGSFLSGFLGTLLAAALIAAGASVLIGLTTAGHVLSGVRVGGVALGGLDRVAAESRLRAELPSISSGSLSISVAGQVTTVPWSSLGRRYDVEAMLDAAYGVGRGDDPGTVVIQRLRDLLVGTPLPVQVHGYDDLALRQLVVQIGVAHHAAPAAASVSVGKDGTIAVVPASDGTSLDVRALQQQIVELASSPAAGDRRVQVALLTLPPSVSTAQAEVAAATARSMTSAPLVLTDGHDQFSLAPATLAGLLTFGTASDGTYGPSVSAPALQAAVADLARRVDRKAKDASYVWAARVEVVPAVVGRSLDQAAAISVISAALGQRAAGSVQTAPLLVPFTTTQPGFSTAQAEAAAPRLVRIGTWTTYYFPGISNGYGANITVPAQALNGKVIGPGATFDFWRDIGPVTAARGYRYGGAIINGKSEPTGAFAGGICSASTTMFNAALRAGLQMGERWNHYYYISRYPVGLDATVFADGASVWSMSWTNDTAYPILIRSFTSYGVVRFDLYSVPTGRTVTLTTPITSNWVYAHDTTQYTSSLPKGTEQRVEGVYNGFDAQVTRYVRDRNGVIIHQDTFYSHYHPVNGILLIGTG